MGLFSDYPTSVVGLAYLVLYVSFLIAVWMIPFIRDYLAAYTDGLLLYLASSAVAFVLMIVVLPKLLAMLFK